MQKLIQGGWERAVFRAPLRDGEDSVSENVLPGPGQCAATEDDLQGLWKAMNDAAARGEVKQVIVIDAHRRLEIDARHGSLRQKKRDEASLHKMMGNKKRHLRPDRSEAFLRELGLLNADGSMNRRHARKYKQVHHFVELCQPLFKELAAAKDGAPLHILDLACGNSYLSFALLEALRLENQPARLLGIDIDPRWIEASQARAKNLPELDAHFRCGRIEDFQGEQDPILQEPDLVVALHACDTASDQAIALALSQNVPALLCSPCCHAEIAKQVGPGVILPGLEALGKHGLLRRAWGELLTDALRIAWIEAHGYEISLLEFVGAEHSAKNLLIRAIRKGEPNQARLAELRAQTEVMGLAPALQKH